VSVITNFKYLKSKNIFFLNEANYLHLKKLAREKHKKIKLNSDLDPKLFESQDYYARKYGFKSWSDLNSIYKYEAEGQSIHGEVEHANDPNVTNAYTHRQEYGAICRHYNIDPLIKKHEIHITIGEENFLEYLTAADLRDLGLVEDEKFHSYLTHNDPYFRFVEIYEPVYRVVSIDTDSFQDLEDSLNVLGQKVNNFWPLMSKNSWINGKIDPYIFEFIEIENEEYQERNKAPFPLKSLPDEIWKGCYK
jgi:hypothetical protein